MVAAVEAPLVSAPEVKAAVEAPHRHGFWTKLFYGFGSVAYGVKDNGFSVFLLIFYNQVLGLPAAKAGLALMLALVIDSVIDPAVGYLSDNLRTRWGRRHPFMYATAVPTSLAYLFLWFPPAGLSQDGLFYYLVAMAILVRSLITCFEIPNSALVAELTSDYDERTKYLSFRFFFGWWGGLTLSLLTYAVLLRPTPGHPIGQLNPDGYHRYAFLAAAMMFAGMMVSALGTHSAIRHLRQPPARQRLNPRESVKEIWEALGHSAALSLLGNGMLVATVAGVVFSLATYMYTFFWRLSSSQIAVLTLPSFIAAAVALAVTPPLSRRFGKKATGIAVTCVALMISPIMIGLKLAGVLPADGSWALVTLLFVQIVFSTALGTITPILVTSMLADVVEQNELKFGRRTEGVLFAANAFIVKCVTGLGIFISGAILSFAQFPAKAKPGQVPEPVLLRLVLTYIGVVVALYALSVVCLFAYRITRERHAANLRALEAALEEFPTEEAPRAAQLL